MFDKIFFILLLSFATEMNFFTSIEPSVRVPVLSKHKVSTLARASMQYKSWTRTFDFDNLVTLTANTVLVKSTRPSGIIPIKAATVWTTALLKVIPSICNWL